MKKRVLVAMSGGVDSSVASYLLKKRGFDVVGVTMCLGIKDADRRRPVCCGRKAIEDAKRVCAKLGIPHYVMDFSKELERDVVNTFVSEYLKGRTPNPCVDCNRHLKFDTLLKKALVLGFDYLATGHYAKIAKKGKGFLLKRARDRKKDQSYFLYPIKKESLKFLLFPLGDLTKAEVRRIAKRAKLSVAEKPQSQDICFIPDKNYHAFISRRTKKKGCGPILDLDGNLLGEHKGAFFYTIGQRGGLGIGYKHPLYVLSINAGKNQLVVGNREHLKARGLVAKDVNLLDSNFSKDIYAKIRYNHKEARCKIFRKGKKARLLFKRLEEAITPGQSVVFYRRDTVLGGGVIDEVIRG